MYFTRKIVPGFVLASLFLTSLQLPSAGMGNAQSQQGIVIGATGGVDPGSRSESTPLGLGRYSPVPRGEVTADVDHDPNDRLYRSEPDLNIGGQGVVLSSLDADAPYGWRAWDGNNPFHQPATTTDYYGSGDANGDGVIDTGDVSRAQDMVDGVADMNARADVDGDGDVDAVDVSLIEGARLGGTLPGWWNQLTSRVEREHWVDRVLALDQTDAHPYAYWWQCAKSSAQLFTHSTLYRGDISRTHYDGGQTRFNIPMYTVGVYGHAINGILVGDDPLSFDDWRFVEPQTDLDVTPGMWDMPYGAVRVDTPEEIYVSGHTVVMKVTFTVSTTGWTLDDYDPSLILHRPTPTTQTPDNRPDFWNPTIVPVGSGAILFERHRDDLTRTVDIHLSGLPYIDPPDGTPLVFSSHTSRLLDVSQGYDGSIHLLWKGKDDYTPGVFHGRLDIATGEITGTTRVSAGSRMPLMGRLFAVPEDEVHVFWLEGRSNASHPHLPGVYWSKWTETGWQAEQNLTPDTYHNLYDYLSWGDHSSIPYFFDVAVYGNDIVLAWAERQGVSTHEALLRHRVYDGSWGTPTTVESTNVRGLDLAADSDGGLHMAYWLGAGGVYGEGRGNLLHRTYDGAVWSTPQTVDASGNAAHPRMAAGADGELYLVWEREVEEQVFPVWNRYRDGAWSVSQALDVRAGAQAWYPTVDALADSSLQFAWSSRSDDRVTIETLNVTPVYANLSGTPRSGIAPQVVAFANISTGDYSESWWDLGDGWVSAMQHPSHQYTVGGEYTVTLKVSGPGGTDTIAKTRYITIYTPVDAGFTAVPTTGVAPLMVDFDNTSSGDYSESLWSFGNGESSTEESPAQLYTDPGVYTVTLTVSGSGGSDSETKTAYIEVRHGAFLPLTLNNHY